jgi:hypothetical protein
MQLSLNLGLQCFGALFTAAGTVNDMWNGLTVSMVYLLEASATLCILWSTMLVSGGPKQPLASAAQADSNVTNATVASGGFFNATAASKGDDDEFLMSVARAAELATTAANLLQAAIFLPLLLTVYDVAIVPMVHLLWRTEGGSCVEVGCAFLIALVVLPLQLLESYFGRHPVPLDDGVSMMDTYRDGVTDVASNAACGSDTAIADIAGDTAANSNGGAADEA